MMHPIHILVSFRQVDTFIALFRPKMCYNDPSLTISFLPSNGALHPITIFSTPDISILIF